jgi:hypothetical protein
MGLESGDSVRLNSPVELTCRVSNVYPKPRIIMMHSLRENIQTSVKENDVSIVEDEFNPYHLYTLTATYNFTPSYSDNNQNVMCTVISQGNTNATVSSKPFTIKVEGLYPSFLTFISHIKLLFKGYFPKFFPFQKL